MNESGLPLFDRADDMTQEEVVTFFSYTPYEEQILSKLSDSGTYLIEGCRGTGKTMLLKMAQYHMDNDFRNKKSRTISVFVKFSRALALERVQSNKGYHPFRQWMFAKLLSGLIQKLRLLNIATDDHLTLLSIGEKPSVSCQDLDIYIDRLEKTAQLESITNISSNIQEELDNPDSMRDNIISILNKFDLSRVVFLLDEVAQYLPDELQQEFFSIISHLRNPKINCKIAVYPHLTSYGRDFSIGHDAIVIPLERPVEDDSFMPFFEEIVNQRIIKSPLSAAFNKNPIYLKILCKACFGNPRALIHLIAGLPIRDRLEYYEVLNAIKDNIDLEQLKYLSSLKDRMRNHNNIVQLAEDVLDTFLYDLKEMNYKQGERTHCVAVSSLKALPYRIHKAIDILVYTGLIGRRGTCKISSRESAIRYLLHFGLLIKENALTDSTKSSLTAEELYERLSKVNRDKRKEYTRNSPTLHELNKNVDYTNEIHCPNCDYTLPITAKFCSNCGTKLPVHSLYDELASHAIDKLELSPKIIDRLRQAGFSTVGDILNTTDAKLDAVPMIGDYRVQIIRYAAEEYISS